MKGPLVLLLIWNARFDSFLIAWSARAEHTSWSSDLRLGDYVRLLQSLRLPRAWEVTPGRGGVGMGMFILTLR